MDWQSALVAVLVASSAAYLAWRSWRAWAGRKEGCGGCSCAKGKEAKTQDGEGAWVPSDGLTLIARDGAGGSRPGKSADSG